LKLAYLLNAFPHRGLYPADRAKILLPALNTSDHKIFVLSSNTSLIQYLEKHNIPTCIYKNNAQLLEELKLFKPNCIIHDSGNSEKDLIRRLKEFNCSLIHFDDTGDGAAFADLVFQTLYENPKDLSKENYVYGPTGYIPALKEIHKNNNMLQNPPHIVVAFPYEDPENLTYRTLRHLVQLHIPLQISVVVDEHYKHDISDLKRFALTRKSIKVISTKDPESYIYTSDIVITSGAYTPFFVAQLKIPCIVLCAHEEEMNYAFSQEENGFANLGLGRKIKQSYLQNAVMEIILHDNRRNAYIQKQKHFQFSSNLEEVVQLIEQSIANKKEEEEIVR
jgi:spore coat polysaccharide biosynthesis predicted glycosyltransferase SpsG